MTVVLAIAVLALAAALTYVIVRQRAGGAELSEERLAEFMASTSVQLQATAGEELRKASEHVLEVSKQQRELEREAATESLDRRKQEIAALTKPLEEALKRVGEGVDSLAKQRSETDAVLGNQIRSLGEQTERLGQALRNPKGRGDWGEVQLRRLVELAGMTEHVDFELQKEVGLGDTRLRPDMVVRMPGKRTVTVDSKVALDALEEAQVAESEAVRVAALRRLASAIKAQIKNLASKDYQGQFEAGQSPDFVICHIRVEAALFGAMEVEPNLYEDALARNVVISTPLTLVALLRTIELGWRTEKMAEEAQEIAEAGRDLHKRSGVFLKHFSRVGKELDQAVGAYNDAVGSAERNVLPKLRHIEKLGAASGKDLEQPAKIEQLAKSIVAEELREIEGNPEAPATELPSRVESDAA